MKKNLVKISKSKKIQFILFLFIITFNLILASRYVVNSDIHFTADIARDFLIYDEIKNKIIIFIGGRTSSGLFHGPLWWYLTYPGYYLGNGNPIIVGWYWILLIITSLIAGFFVAKNLFNISSAYLYIIMISIMYVFHSNALINPHGSMFVLPLFFYFFIRYLQTYKLRFLIFHLITAGAMIQFEMAVGIPFTLLSLPVIAYYAIRTRHAIHLLSFVILSISVINFIIFDFRHDFILIKKAFEFITPNVHMGHTTYPSMILDRIISMFSISFLWNNEGFRNVIISLIFVLFLILQIRNKKYSKIYFSFIYFYIGFFILSLINKGYMLSFYLYPVLPLPLLIFASFITSKYKKAVLSIIIIIYLLNLQSAIGEIQNAKNFIGKNEISWNAVYSLASRAFRGKEKELGFFVYSPDAFAYAPQYVMEYAAKMNSQKVSYRFQKKKVTYILIAPPPPDKPFMLEDWWIVNKLKITNKPVKTIILSNNYKLEKFILTDKETQIPFDPTIDVGLHFR